MNDENRVFRCDFVQNSRRKRKFLFVENNDQEQAQIDLEYLSQKYMIDENILGQATNLSELVQIIEDEY